MSVQLKVATVIYLGRKLREYGNILETGMLAPKILFFLVTNVTKNFLPKLSDRCIQAKYIRANCPANIVVKPLPQNHLKVMNLDIQVKSHYLVRSVTMFV